MFSCPVASDRNLENIAPCLVVANRRNCYNEEMASVDVTLNGLKHKASKDVETEFFAKHASQWINMITPFFW